jgi:hypothetical protein
MLDAEAVRDRHFERKSLAAVGLDAGFHFVGELVARMVVERYVGSLARENVTDRRADPACTSGNEGALPLK